MVDGAGDQLFAGAALPGDQDDDVLGGDAADGLVDLHHARAAPDDGVAAVLGGGCLGDHRRSSHQPPEFQGLDDNAAQPSEVERFEEVVVGALLHRLDGGVGGRGPGDEDDGDAAVDLTDPLVSIQPRQVGEVHVEQDDVGRLGRDLAEPFLGRVSDLDANALGTQGMNRLIQDHRRIVINQQHSSHNQRSRTENPDARLSCNCYYNIWALAYRARAAVNRVGRAGAGGSLGGTSDESDAARK